MSKAVVEKEARTGCALGLYRSLLNLALLVAAFREFPGHETAIALAVLVFSQGIAAIGMGQRLVFAQQNHLDDLAERKTRHAIVLAAERDDSHGHFWSEVDRRVSDEMEPAEKVAWWAHAGLGLLTFGGYLVVDLITIGLAASLA